MPSVKREFLLLLAVLFFSRVNAYLLFDTTKTIAINAIGGLQYDVVRFQVRPDSKVRIVFTNKDDMSHNLVFGLPDSRMKIVDAATALGGSAAKADYVPRIKEVLWSLPVIGPGEEKSISFTTPKTEGIYPYVCTFPGHGLVMYGAMYVTDKKILPPLADDANIPPGARKSSDAESRMNLPEREIPHSFREDPPFLYRIFLPDASPASIAVNLPNNISYCWDAGVCRLRYAWTGGFLDNTEIWKGHKNAYGEILGDVFLKDNGIFPLQFDKPGNVPTVKFRGYRLINRFPEFHYTLDGVDVFELIKPKEDGVGLIRTFSISQTDRIIWFVTGKDDEVNYEASSGEWEGSSLKIYPAKSNQLTIIMTKK